MIIVLGICLAAILIGAGLYFYGPEELRETPQPTGTQASPLTADQLEAVPFSVIGEGVRAADVSERKNYAVYVEEEFARLWTMAYGEDAPLMPEVDFASEYVIGVFAGQKPSGGHAIRVERIEDGNTVRTVSVTLEEPDSGCVVTQALTSPFQLVRVPLTDRDHARSETVVTVSCD